MTVKQRIERLEGQPDNKPPELIMVSPQDNDMFYSGYHKRSLTQEELSEIAANGTRVLIFEPHRPGKKRPGMWMIEPDLDLIERGI